MELIEVNANRSDIHEKEVIPSSKGSQFIESNTTQIDYERLRKECVIPNFAKDNESTISHPEFIDAVYEVAQDFFNGEIIGVPTIRVSHPIKGRVPDAIGKPAFLLKDYEKTLYFERMAFLIDVPFIRDTVDSHDLSLSIGGVRAYNLTNLHRTKTEESFKVFIGFKNLVCINLCISTDGFISNLRARTVDEIKQSALKLFSNYSALKDIKQLRELLESSITESQFAKMVGRARMYQYLPPSMKKEIPALPVGDTLISIVVKDYFKDESFCRDKDGSIDLWRLYNLLTGANKSSYVDSFLDRNVGNLTFIKSLQDALKSSSEHWHLS